MLVYEGCGGLVYENGINEFGQGDNIVCGSFWAGRYFYCKECKIKSDALHEQGENQKTYKL